MQGSSWQSGFREPGLHIWGGGGRGGFLWQLERQMVSSRNTCGGWACLVKSLAGLPAVMEDQKEGWG